MSQNNSCEDMSTEENEASEAVKAFLRNSKPHRSAPPASADRENPPLQTREHVVRKNSANERPPVVSRSYENNQGGLGKQLHNLWLEFLDCKISNYVIDQFCYSNSRGSNRKYGTSRFQVFLELKVAKSSFFEAARQKSCISSC